METRASALEGAYKQVADRLNGMDSRLKGTDSGLNGMVVSGVGIIGMWVSTMLVILYRGR